MAAAPDRRLVALLTALAALAWLLTLPGLAARAAAERSERRVELILGYEPVASLAARRQEPTAALLGRFREAGVTSVAVREATLLRLEAQGRLQLLEGEEVAAAWSALRPILVDPPPAEGLIRSDWTYAAGADPDLGRWLHEAWWELHRRGWPPEPPMLFAQGGRWLLVVPAGYAHAKNTPLGFPPSALADVRSAGLDLVPVLREPPAIPGLPAPRPAEAWGERAEAWRAAGHRTRLVLLDGDPAPGYPDRLPEVGALIRQLGAEVGLIEDWDLLGYLTGRGARDLVAAAAATGVRVYTVQPELRPRLPAAEQLDRIATSLLERRLRAVYLEPLSGAVAADPLADSLAFVRQLARRLAALGLEAGPVRPFPGVDDDPLLLGAALAALAAALALAGLRTLTRAGWHRSGLRAGAVALPAAGLGLAWAVLPPILLRQAAAFLAAVALPLLAADAALAAAASLPAARTPAGALLRGVVLALAGTAAAAASGLLVAALLTADELLMAWQSFRGVKASLALPVLILAAWLLLEQRPRRPPSAAPQPSGVPQPAASPRPGGSAPPGADPKARLLWVAVAIAVAAAVLVAVRTEAWKAPPALELFLRRELTDLLTVRPRFKEFLVGVPALALLGALAPPRGSLPAVALALAAVVGLASVVNSFAHVYTPLAVSLWRTANGLLLGLALAAVPALLAGRLAGRLAVRSGAAGRATGRRQGGARPASKSWGREGGPMNGEAVPAGGLRPTRVEIDLAAVAHNLRRLRAAVGVPVMAVVKADGYGHGAVPVSRALVEAGAAWLAVATVEEGAELRLAGLSAPILVLGWTPDPEAVAAALRHDLRLTVCDAEGLELVAGVARSLGRAAPVHLKVDTGMGRLGLPGWDPDATAGTVLAAARRPELICEGLYTHFACADEPDPEPTLAQIAALRAVLDRLGAAGFRPPIVHAANSAGALRFAEARCDLVRFGIALYGLDPFPGANEVYGLRPAMRWVTRVAQVKRLPAGQGVSYGRTFVAPSELTVAVLPVGYADGYSRALSGRGRVLIGGRRVPVLGRVCMDQIIVGPVDPRTRPGDEVVLIGRQGGEEISAGELASWIDTIHYEVAVKVSRRVPRVYRGREAPQPQPVGADPRGERSCPASGGPASA